MGAAIRATNKSRRCDCHCCLFVPSPIWSSLRLRGQKVQLELEANERRSDSSETNCSSATVQPDPVAVMLQLARKDGFIIRSSRPDKSQRQDSLGTTRVTCTCACGARTSLSWISAEGLLLVGTRARIWLRFRGQRKFAALNNRPRAGIIRNRKELAAIQHGI